MKTIKALYLGKRLSGDSTTHCFRIGKKEVYFQHHKWGVIGHWYEIKQSKDGYTKERRARSIEGPEQTKEDIRSWEAEEAEVENYIKEKRMAKKLAGTPSFLESIDTLKATLKKAGFVERKLLLQWLMDWSDK